MNQMLGYIRLQQIDNRLDQIKARIIKIKSILADDMALQQISREKNAIEEKNNASRINIETLERAIHDQQVKIQQTEANLYSGNLKNPKELQELQLDLASIKRLVNSLENNLLEAMFSLEECEKEHEKVSEKYNTIKSDFDSKNSTFLLEQSALMNEIEKLNTEKKAAESTLSTQDISFYNQLRIQRGGIAVSSISENACDSCGTSITPAQEQAVRSSDRMVICPSCGRMLYSS
jgi:predicted  nucleic acid-binding Zn-ribbon protein